MVIAYQRASHQLLLFFFFFHSPLYRRVCECLCVCVCQKCARLEPIQFHHSQNSIQIIHKILYVLVTSKQLHICQGLKFFCFVLLLKNVESTKSNGEEEEEEVVAEEEAEEDGEDEESQESAINAERERETPTTFN